MGAHMPRGASGNLQPDFIAVLYGEVCTSATDMIVTDVARPVQATGAGCRIAVARRCAAGKALFLADIREELE